MKSQQHMEAEHLKQVLEGLLFAHGRAISVEELKSITQASMESINAALQQLANDYDSKNSALMIVREGSSWKMTIRERFMPFVRRIVSDLEMPKSLLQTLAVIAWKAPIKQSDVVKLRGNKAYDHVKELEKLEFISKEKSGHSYILKPTQKFHQYFEVVNEHELKSLMENVKIPVVKPKQSQEKSLEELKKQVSAEVQETRNVIKKELASAETFLKTVEEKLEKVSKNVDVISKDFAKQVPREQPNEQEQNIEKQVVNQESQE